MCSSSVICIFLDFFKYDVSSIKIPRTVSKCEKFSFGLEKFKFIVKNNIKSGQGYLLTATHSVCVSSPSNCQSIISNGDLSNWHSKFGPAKQITFRLDQPNEIAPFDGE
jgi:hypothetical protein